MRQKAKAMVFEEIDKPFSTHLIDLPIPKFGEVLVAVDYSTICTSDLHTFYGRRKAPCPSILGHEAMGKVISVGPGGVHDFSGKKLKKGDRVTWSVYAYDRSDPMALKGFPQKSQYLYKYGHETLNDKDNLNGGFSTHCLLHEGTCIYVLPKSITDKEAAPLNCSHATMSGALRLAGDVKKKNVAIIGTGMLGLSGCAMARENGAHNVMAIDLNPERLTNSLNFGVNITIDAQKEVKELRDTTQKIGGLDVVIDTSGNPTAIEHGISLLNVGGICVLVGAVYTQRDLSINAETLLRKLLTIKGLHNYIPEDLYRAIRFIHASKHKYPYDSLVDNEYHLEELNAAFKLAEKGQSYRVGIRTDPPICTKTP